jgi:signal transduction histidine kinase
MERKSIKALFSGGNGRRLRIRWGRQLAQAVVPISRGGVLSMRLAPPRHKRIHGQLARSDQALRQALADLQAAHSQLQAAQLQLIQAAKMESIGTLAAGVAHEVKNPLQTILMGLAYLSKNVATADENIGAVLHEMRESVKRADGIVRDLLYLSSSRKLEMREANLNAVLEHALWLVNFEITRAGICVELDLAAELPLVALDPAKMEQVFINLFLNAAQAMEDGGTLRVKTSSRVLEAARDATEPGGVVFHPGDTVVIAEIQDTGVGIPHEKLTRIFEPFFTTKPTGMGTGLGLPVTKQIVDLHGGSIHLEPAERRGVRVTLMLRANPPKAENI